MKTVVIEEIVGWTIVPIPPTSKIAWEIRKIFDEKGTDAVLEALEKKGIKPEYLDVEEFSRQIFQDEKRIPRIKKHQYLIKQPSRLESLYLCIGCSNTLWTWEVQSLYALAEPVCMDCLKKRLENPPKRTVELTSRALKSGVKPWETIDTELVDKMWECHSAMIRELKVTMKAERTKKWMCVA